MMVRYGTAALVTFGLIVLGLGMAAGGAGASGVAWNGHGGSSSTGNSTGTWNVSANHPTWNFGNLCNATKNGSTVWCVYSGGSGGGWGHHSSGQVITNCGYCTPSLSYNFSGDQKTVYILISNLSSSDNNVFLNIHGDHDTIYLNISGGCSGGNVNLTLYGQHDVINVNYTASHIVSVFNIYLDHDAFNAWYGGNDDVSVTYFTEVGTKKLFCPYGNASRTDSATVSSAGYWDVQYLVWTNGVGYSTSLHYTNMTSTFNSTWGPHDYLGWENSTSAWCGWAIAPPCKTGSHHGWNGVEAGKAPD
jgi:hypothetical protein